MSSCRGLKKVSLGAGLKEIGEYAFSSCTSLGGPLELPEGLERIGRYAFSGCGSLTGELRIPTGIKKIEDSTFSSCKGLESLILPEGLTEIGSYAFQDCTNLGGTLELPDSLERIGSDAFGGCSGISGELEIPGKIKEVPSYAFSGMEKVESLIVGKNVSSISTDNSSSHAFYNWNGVKTVTFRGSVPPKPSDSYYSIFKYMPSLEKIYVPENALSVYQAAYDSKLPESVEWSTDTSELPPSNLQADRIYSHTVHLKWKPVENENVAG